MVDVWLDMVYERGEREEKRKKRGMGGQRDEVLLHILL